MGGRRFFWDDAEVVAVGVEVAGALPSPQLGEVAGRVAVGDEDGPSDTSGVGLAPKSPVAGGFFLAAPGVTEAAAVLRSWSK